MRASHRCSSLAALAVAVVLLAPAFPASAQVFDRETTIVVANPGNPYFDQFSDFTTRIQTANIEDAINQAVAQAQAGAATSYTVLILANIATVGQAAPDPWSGNITIPAGVGLTLLGFPRGAPQDIIIQSAIAGLPALTVTRNANDPAVSVEGLTFTGAAAGGGANEPDGIQVRGPGTVEVSRCYIRGNARHGVSCQAGAGVTLTNCSIDSNRQNGVHLAVGAGTASITHCTITRNGRSGVFATGATTADVKYSLVYRNGQGDPEQNNGFDANTPPAGWIPDPEWQYGTPAGGGTVTLDLNADPTAGHTGDYVYGVNLAGDYSPPAPVIAPPNTPLPALTADGVDLTIPFTVPPGIDAVGDVNLFLNIEHTNVEQLTARLTSPSGTEIILFDRAGAPGTVNFLSELNDQGPLDVMADPGPFVDPTQPVRPQERLSAFAGERATGPWRLTIEDSAGECNLVDEDFSAPLTDWELKGVTFDERYQLPQGALSQSLSLKSGSSIWRDCEMKFTMDISPGSPSNSEVAAFLRYNNIGGESYYKLAIRPNGAQADLVFSAKQKTSTEVVLAATTVAAFPYGVPVDVILSVEGQIATGGVTLRIQIPPVVNITVPDLGIDVVEGTVGLMSQGVITYFDDVCVTQLPILGGVTGAIRDARLEFTPQNFLTSAPLDVPGSIGLRLEYYRWLNQDPASGATVQARSNGMPADTWITLWDKNETGAAGVKDEDWAEVSLDVDTARLANTTTGVQFRWGYYLEANPTLFIPAAGWNIDDVVIYSIPSAGDVGGIVQDGGSTVTIDTNDVFENQLDNYVGLAQTDIDASNSLSVEPKIVFSPWAGKITDTTSELINKVTGATVERDFEYAVRSTGEADIGADEYSGTGGEGYWEYCVVTRNPIGRLEPGQLRVEIGYTGNLDTNTGIFLLPQLGNEADPTTYIPLNITGGNQYTGVYFATNTDPITTSLTNGTNRPDPGDLVADGHGMIYLVHNGAILSNSYISASAQQGRHVLIDTVPPRFLHLSGDPNVLTNNVVLPPQIAVLNNSGPYAAMGVVAGAPPGPWHAFTAVDLGAGLPQIDDDLTLAFATRAPFAPVVDPATSSVGQEDPKVFFNVASVSNNYAEAPLDVTVRPQFVDVSVAEAFPELGLDPDAFQVAGFATGSIAAAPVNDVLPSTESIFPPARWDLAVTGSLGSVLAVSNFVATRNNVAGYFDLVAESHIAGAKNMRAEWSFTDGALPGIPLAALFDQDRLHMAGRFNAIDQAGNRADREAGFQGPPLNLWWLRGRHLRTGDFNVTQNAASGEAYPTVQWRYNPGYSLGINNANPDNPRIQYTFRLYASQEYGQANNTWYDPITNWRLWSPDNILLPGYFAGIQKGLNEVNQSLLDRNLLIVVSAMDEAGNVEPWPFDDFILYPSGTINKDVSGSGGTTWREFYVPGEPSALDTTLLATISRVTETASINLGSTAIAQYPTEGRLEATFDIGVVAPTTKGNVGVNVELEADGQVVFSGTIMVDARRRIVLTLPFEGDGGYDWHEDSDPPLNALTVLGAPGRVVNYVFRAATWLTDEGQRDVTPANFYFTVVPGTVQEYLESIKGRQPVKVFEAQ